MQPTWKGGSTQEILLRKEAFRCLRLKEASRFTVVTFSSKLADSAFDHFCCDWRRGRRWKDQLQNLVVSVLTGRQTDLFCDVCLPEFSECHWNFIMMKYQLTPEMVQKKVVAQSAQLL